MALYPFGQKLDEFGARFVLVNLAARRATQLTRDKAPPLLETNSTHPLTIALEEIADGAVVPVFEQAERLPEYHDTLESLDVAARSDSIDSLISELFGGEKTLEEAGGATLVELSPLGESLVDEPTGEFQEGSTELDDLADDLGAEDELLEGFGPEEAKE